MKTMTCKQMGGPCEAQIHGEDANTMMINGGKHIQEMSSKGDEDHKKIAEMMQNMQDNPDSEDNKNWTAKFMADFEALPED